MTTAGGLAGRRVGVVGTGLLGTSLGLALRARDVEVVLHDVDAESLAFAERRGAGRPAPMPEVAASDLVVVAVPPAHIGPVAADVLRAGRAVVTHVGSVQVEPQQHIETAALDDGRFCGGHPVAGRERPGPAYAEAGLFGGRPWVLCPTERTSGETTRLVRTLAEACGADPVVEMSAAEHDALLARLSHGPQLVASAVAAGLVGLGADRAALAGTGLRDLLRIADSDPALWAQIVTANRAAVGEVLGELADSLRALAVALRDGATEEIGQLVGETVRAGAAGRALLPGKHGRPPSPAVAVRVVIPDEPGALAALLAAIADHDVNLEDLRVEHAPGQPTGVAELVVAPAAQSALEELLRAGGWAIAPAEPTTL